MKISLPELSLVVLVGPSGSGKSTFARRHFKPTEVLSSDSCRGFVSDNENDQGATKDAFDVLHFIGSKRLSVGRLTVVDATNVQEEARKPLVALARQHHCLPVAIVFDLPEKVCRERNDGRADRDMGPHVIRQQSTQLRRSLRRLKAEGFRHVFVLRTAEEVDSATVERVPLWNNRKGDHGPFDIIGDVHGCCDELEKLLAMMGYAVEDGIYRHPEGRKVVFLGDLVDRGPRILDTINLARRMVAAGTAMCVPGNHEIKLMRRLLGRDVRISHGMAQTLAEIDALPDEARESTRKELAEFIDSLVSHYVFDDGNLVVAHAGLREEMQGRGSGKVREFALYGETTGETDEFGLPVRYNWAAEYRGRAYVVYGHTPVPEADWLNRTVCIDTGCVYGGKLTALRYPEREFASVPAARVYFESAKPFPSQAPPALTAQQQHDDVLHIEDVLGKRIVTTRLHHSVTVREENAIAALEVMSRFAANPKWLIHLPPTMSPCETSKREGLLEHPEEAFAHYRAQGISSVVCEQKHMGSRAVVIICRDEETARRRFGIAGEGFGICVTRTGRRFFDDAAMETAFLKGTRAAIDRAGYWQEFQTEWVCLDAELMPWSAKAQELLKFQYAAVGAAATTSLEQAGALLENGPPDLRDRIRARSKMAQKYVEAYRRYCWKVDSVMDLKLAPFHLLGTEHGVHVDKDHVWHMETLARMAGEFVIATPYKVVDLTDPASQVKGVEWWEELTGTGGEGMVVKPRDFVSRGRKGLVQPALKVRGPEYLRIIYGPEYDAPGNLDRLRSRKLAGKRSLALREFALGVEALERFVRKEPLRRVHECVFGVLALESEPVDPRL